MNFKLSLICLLALLALFSCSDNYSDSPYPAIEFKRQASIPDKGRSSAVGFSLNGKGYVTLGRNGARSGFLNDCWEYDPTQNTWTQKANFPGGGRVKAIAATVGSKAYVGLGFANENGNVYENGGYLKDLWMFDPAENKWERKVDFPGAATDACVSFVVDNMIYVGAGYDGFNLNREVWRYDPANNSWKRLTDFSGPVRSGATCCSDGNRVFFGTGYRNDNLNDWWEYFPATDTWKELKPMPDKGRVNAVAISIKKHFYVLTGRHFSGTYTGGHVKSDIAEYDVQRNVWYQRGNIPDGSRENAVIFSINGIGYIGFGENDNGILNDFWSFEP